MSQKFKKSLYAFLLKTALKKNTSQSNKYPRATLKVGFWGIPGILVDIQAPVNTTTFFQKCF